MNDAESVRQLLVPVLIYRDAIASEDGKNETAEYTYWIKQKVLHHEDGPAYINKTNGRVGFYLYGERISIRTWAMMLNKTGAEELAMKLKYGERV